MRILSNLGVIGVFISTQFIMLFIISHIVLTNKEYKIMFLVIVRDAVIIIADILLFKTILKNAKVIKLQEKHEYLKEQKQQKYQGYLAYEM